MLHALRDVSPSTAINDNDHGAVIRVTAAFCAAITLLALIARLQIRWPWRSLFGRDDILAVVATVRRRRSFENVLSLTRTKGLAVAQMGVVVYGVSEGFGKMSNDLTTGAVNAVKKVGAVSGLRS